MRSKATRGIFFCLLVAFFTVFGQGRSESWSYVASDEAGLEYLVEEKSIHWLSADRVRFRLAAVGADGGRREVTGELDFEARTYLNVGEPSQEIRPGTVAQELFLWFSNRRGSSP